MKTTKKQPFHGEWFIEDQTSTNNGYVLLRYCAALPKIGWHNFGHFESRDAAVVFQARDYKDTESDGVTPWPRGEGR